MTTFINKRSLFLGIATALALSGCFKVSNALPADAPSFVKLYPGSAQVVTVDVAGMKSVVYQAPSAAPDAVLTFYRTQAAAEQMPEQAAPPQANAPADQKQAVFGDPSGAKFLVVVARPQGTGTMVSLTYKPPPKAPS
jgi:hypothetical protein